MAKFRFVIDIEAPKYKGHGDFPPHVHASEILFDMIQRARREVYQSQRKMILSWPMNQNEPKTECEKSYHDYLQRHEKYLDEIEKSFCENDGLVTEIV